MSQTNSTSSGIGVAGLLLVAFIVLKLCHVINWSWLWVLAPLWIVAAIIVVLMLIIILFAGFNDDIE